MATCERSRLRQACPRRAAHRAPFSSPCARGGLRTKKGPHGHVDMYSTFYTWEVQRKKCATREGWSIDLTHVEV